MTPSMFEPNLSQLLPPLPQRRSLVTFAVLVDGSAVPDTVMVKSLAVMRCANRIPYAIVKILDGDPASQSFPSSDMDILSPGKEIEIKAGYHGDNKTIFKGIILRHAVKIPQGEAPHIEIECKDKAVKLTVGRKNKYYFNQKDSDIIEEVLRSEVQPDVEATSVTHAEMVQYYATDWDFVLTRAEANGMLVLADDGKVSVKKPDLDQEPKFPIAYGSSLYEFEAEMDARDQYPTVEVSTWGISDQDVQKATPGGGGALGGFSVPGGSALSSAAGAIGIDLPGQAPNTDYSEVMGLDQLPLQHGGALTSEEAQYWAEAQVTKSKLAKKRGRVKFEGVAEIKPGDCISLQGVGQRHSGKVFITAITHEVCDGRWYTHAQFGLSQRWLVQEFDDVADEPAASLLPAVHGLQIGIVTRLENSPADPEFRIQVRLPMVEGQGDGVWTRLAAQDAGANRGAVWRPEIGDEVVVGFLNDDPRQGIVIGALHSSQNQAPIAASDDNHQKGWVTRSGMKMIFDDDKISTVIETPGGKKVTIDEDADIIRLEDQHDNKITMDQDGIKLQSPKDISLKATGDVKIEGANITQKAQANLKAEAGAQGEFKANADLVLKGTFVRIN